MIKKILNKKKEQKQKKQLPTRITNDTVAEHRERVLAGGRKLKYPVQYTRRKLVLNTIIISFVALLALVALLFVQLYVVRSTGEITYRITRVLPLPVAKVDTQYVRYSDYLLYHRSTMAALGNQAALPEGDENRAQEVEFQQQQALDRALEDAYARMIAKELNITVSSEEVEELIRTQREGSGLSENAYEAVVNDHLHWTMDELRRAMYHTLLRHEVAFAIDETAKTVSEDVQSRLSGGTSLADVAEALSDDVAYHADVIVPIDNFDGGLSLSASDIEVGETSSAVRTLAGDGYYFITRSEAAEGFVRYSYIRVPLTKFAEDFADTRNSDNTQVFIKITQER